MVSRILERSAGPPLVCTSISVPPMKSMPKFRPWKKNSAIAAIDSSAEIGKLMRRKRMKSNLVSSGTMRSRRTSYLSNRVFSLPRIHVAASFSSDRHHAGPPHPDPIGDDQSGQRECGEQRGENADTERHGKAAHRS